MEYVLHAVCVICIPKKGFAFPGLTVKKIRVSLMLPVNSACPLNVNVSSYDRIINDRN